MRWLLLTLCPNAGGWRWISLGVWPGSLFPPVLPYSHWSVQLSSHPPATVLPPRPSAHGPVSVLMLAVCFLLLLQIRWSVCTEMTTPAVQHLFLKSGLYSEISARTAWRYQPENYFYNRGELLSPCRCSGSVRSTHQPCLIKWISERGSWTCELCYYKYQVIAISTKNPLQWQAISLTVIEKVQIAAAILGSLFLIASISWLVWSSLSPSAKWQRQDLLFQICYGMYGFMDVVCI
ncbi:membrane associated ring-CH-type finger 4, partial [Tachysurus ichikawai]